MKKILILVTMLLLLITGCRKASTEIVTSVGEQTDENTKVIHWYTDAACSKCIQLNDLYKTLDLPSDIVIKRHIVAVIPDTVYNYSIEAAKHIVSVQKNQPEIAEDYLNVIQSEEFMNTIMYADVEKKTEKGYVDISENFKEAYVAVKGNDKGWDAVIKDLDKVAETIKEESETFHTKEEVKKHLGDRAIYLPFVYLENGGESIEFEGQHDFFDRILNDSEEGPRGDQYMYTDEMMQELEDLELASPEKDLEQPTNNEN